MPLIPNTPEFRKLLSSIELKNEPSQTLAIPAMSGRYLEKAVTFPALYLHYEEFPTAPFTAIERKLMEKLSRSNHPAQIDVVRLAIAVYSVIQRLYPDPLELFNDLFEDTVGVDVSHYAVLPTIGQSGSPAKYKSYKSGQTKELSLEYRSAKANSDFYILYGNELRDRAAIESPVFKRRVIPFLHYYRESPREQTRIRIEPLFLSILLPYYEYISERYRKDCADHLEWIQSIPGAAGLSVIDEEIFREFVGAQYVTIYLNQSVEKWDGYVVPFSKGIYFNTWAGDPKIINDAISYEKSFPSEHPPIVLQFCNWGYKAKRSLYRQNAPDAFLNYFIAIEILFSEKSNTTKSISTRVAALTASRNEDYNSIQKEVERLYGIRSMYVHQGKEPRLKDAQCLDQVYQDLLPNVLSRKASPAIQEQADREWLKTLDWVATGYDAGRAPDADTRKSLGLNS